MCEFNKESIPPRCHRGEEINYSRMIRVWLFCSVRRLIFAFPKNKEAAYIREIVRCLANSYPVVVAVTVLFVSKQYN